jgi:hypothetical protein
MLVQRLEDLIPEAVGRAAVAKFHEAGILLRPGGVEVLAARKPDPSRLVLLVQHQAVQHHSRGQDRGEEAD